MLASLLQSSNASQGPEPCAANAGPQASPSAIIECVRRVASALGRPGVWARTTGPYILLGLPGGDAFARLIALGGASYGVAFRACGEGSVGVERARRVGPAAWEPVLLVDELSDAVEHALVGVGVTAASSNA